ncbi:MAG TPA: hypothetical protein PKO15_05005 [Fibrobacteria bacterium]|nr:hypothetical protein [Fibrobacteria bacterium]
MASAVPGSDPKSSPRRKGIAPWKIVVGILGGGALLLGMVVVAVVVFISMHKDDLLKKGAQAQQEGSAYGELHDQSECVAKVVGRLDSTDFLGEIGDRLFLGSCLQAARPVDGFCMDVPPSRKILSSVAWRLKACAKAGREGNEECSRMLEEVQKFCNPDLGVSDSGESSDVSR